MIISSDIIEFKNNIIQTVYTASEIKKHIITSITKNDEEPIIQKTRIIKSIKELRNSLKEFKKYKLYEKNTLSHLKHIDEFISETINKTEINETNFKKIQEIRNKLILSLYNSLIQFIKQQFYETTGKAQSEAERYAVSHSLSCNGEVYTSEEVGTIDGAIFYEIFEKVKEISGIEDTDIESDVEEFPEDE